MAAYMPNLMPHARHLPTHHPFYHCMAATGPIPGWLSTMHTRKHKYPANTSTQAHDNCLMPPPQVISPVRPQCNSAYTVPSYTPAAPRRVRVICAGTCKLAKPVATVPCCCTNNSSCMQAMPATCHLARSQTAQHIRTQSTAVVVSKKARCQCCHCMPLLLS